MKHFTDADLQAYLDGDYAGDKQAIDIYLQSPEGQERLAAYRVLFQVLKEQSRPALNFSLSKSVLSQLDSRIAKPIIGQERYLWFPLTLAVIAFLIFLVLYIRDLSFFTQLNTIISGTIILLLFFMISLHMLDLSKQHERYKKLIAGDV